MSLKERLLSMEDEFLDALTAGDGALSAFNDRWESFVDEINNIDDSIGLDIETSTLVHSTAFRIATLAETSAGILASCDDLTSQLIDEVDALMAELTLDGPSTLSSWHSSPSSSRSSSSSSTSSPHRQCSKRRYAHDDDTELPTPRKRKRSNSDMEHSALATSSKRSCTPSHAQPAPIVSVPLWPCAIPLTSSRGDAEPRSPTSLPSRKRRLSDADIDPKPKRLHVGPRLHAVSDTFATKELTASGVGRSRFPLPSLYPSTRISTPRRSAPPLDIQPLALSLHSSERFEERSLFDSSLATLPSLDLTDLDSFIHTMLDGHPPALLHEANVLFNDSLQLHDRDLVIDPSSPSISTDSCPSYPITPPTSSLDALAPSSPWVIPHGESSDDVVWQCLPDLATTPNQMPEEKIRNHSGRSSSSNLNDIDWASLFDCADPFGWMLPSPRSQDTLEVGKFWELNPSPESRTTIATC